MAGRECYSISLRGQKQTSAQALIIVQNKDGTVLEIDEEIDPRIEEKVDLEPLEELEEVQLDEVEPSKKVKVGKHLLDEAK